MRHIVQLKSLRYFLMVANTGSFLATARHFQAPASSVSRFISALEQELGQQLFYRSTRAVRLTEAGTRFLVQVQEAIALLDDAVEKIARQDADIQGLVRINAPAALGRLHIAGIISSLQSRYAKLIIELTLTDAYIDPVQEGADIIIRVGPLVDSGLIGKVISAQRYIIAASPAYLAHHGVPQTPDDLARHSCLLYKGLHGMQKWYFRRSRAEGFAAINVSGVVRSNNAEVLVASALAGQGIVLFPTWLFSEDNFSRQQLIKLFPDWEVAAAPENTFIQLLSPENRLRSQRVSTVFDFIASEIGSPPYWDAC